MTEGEIRAALDGLHAYDTGCVDSGIHDEALRRRVLDTLAGLPGRDRRAMLARILRDLYLTDAAIAQGYGCEDAGDFVRWLNDWMGSVHIA